MLPAFVKIMQSFILIQKDGISRGGVDGEGGGGGGVGGGCGLKFCALSDRY